MHEHASARAAVETMIRSRDLEGLLRHAETMHGHRCPFLALGVKAGQYAMTFLDQENTGMEEVVAIVECNNCFTDGIQVAERLRAQDRVELYLVALASLVFLVGCFLVTVLETHRTAGAAHNLALHGTGTDFHLVLNPDIELAPDALLGLRRHQFRRRAEGAHAAGVQPLVAIERPLVVLRGREEEIVLSIDERVNGALLALQEFLDDYLADGSHGHIDYIHGADAVERAEQLVQLVRAE